MKVKYPVAGFLAVLLLMSGCGGEKNFTSQKKDGVLFVHNRGPASTEPSARLEFVRRIGEMETEDENLMFVFPIHAAEDGEGNLYVLDSQDFCVKKYDRDGNFLLKFGRQGQGPGEFQYPMRVICSGNDHLVVDGMDSTRRIFDLSGEYAGGFTLGQYEGMFLEAMQSGRFVGYSFSVGGENKKDNKLLKIFDIEGKTLHSFGEPMLLTRTQDTWNANFVRLAVDKKDDIYAAFIFQNRIEKYSPEGEILMSVDRELPFPVEYKVVKESMDIGGQARQIERLRSAAFSRGIGMDREGRIWILAVIKQPSPDMEREAYVPHEYTRFEVYDPEGVLLYHVPMPEELQSFDNIVQCGDNLYFMDPFGECCVFHYRIVNK